MIKYFEAAGATAPKVSLGCSFKSKHIETQASLDITAKAKEWTHFITVRKQQSAKIINTLFWQFQGMK